MSSEVFGAVESHVEDALLFAQDLAQDGPVHAAHVLGGVLLVARAGTRSPAFQAFARLVPEMVVEAPSTERTLTLCPERFSEPFRSSLNAVRSVLSGDWDRAMLWGRDLITAVLLTRHEDLLGQLSQAQLETLRDAWYEFLTSQAELPEAAYVALWLRARVPLPRQVTPGGENQLLFVRDPTSVWIRKVQCKPWALGSIDAFVLPAGGMLSEHARSFLGYELFEPFELSALEGSEAQAAYAVAVPKAAQGAGLPPLCIVVDPKSYEEQTPAQAVKAALEAGRLAAEAGAERVVLPLLGAGAVGFPSSQVLRELLYALAQEPLDLEQVVITTRSDDDVALARMLSEELVQSSLPAVAPREAPVLAERPPRAYEPAAGAEPARSEAVPDAARGEAAPDASGAVAASEAALEALPTASAPEAPLSTAASTEESVLTQHRADTTEPATSPDAAALEPAAASGAFEVPRGPAAPAASAHGASSVHTPAPAAAPSQASAATLSEARAASVPPAARVSVAPAVVLSAPAPAASKVAPAREAKDASSPDCLISPDGEHAFHLSEQVRAVADVIAARERTLPLTIGVYGPSGSGKTSFLDHLERRLALLEATARAAGRSGQATAYCERMVHVRFSALQDGDGHVGAALVERVVEQLAEALASRDKGADAVREALAQKLRVVQELLAEREHVAQTLAKRRGELEDELTRLLRERDDACEDLDVASPHALAEAAAQVPSVETLINEARRAYHDLSAQAVPTTFVELERELSGLASRLGVAWAQWGRVSEGARTFALALLALSIVAPFASAFLREPYAVWASLGLWLATVATWASGLLPRLRQAEAALGLVRKAQHASEAEAERLLAEQQGRIRKALARVAELESQLASVRERLRQTERQMADVQDQIAKLSVGAQLRTFIQERAASAGPLSVLATLRSDFSQLERLLGEVHQSKPANRAARPIERVVIYVDDLDRCPAQRVVEVLQTLRLLLDSPMFVAVVSADPRWLCRALESHYGAELARDFLQDALEIPVALRPLDAQAFRALMTRLVPVQPVHEESGAIQTLTPAARASELNPDPDALRLSPHETALMQQLWGLGLTPGATRRFVNLYYFVRASLPDEELAEFVGTDQAPGSCATHIFLLGVLIAWPEAAEHIFTELRADARMLRVGALLQRAEEALAARGVADHGGEAPRLVELARSMGLPSRAALLADAARRIEPLAWALSSARPAPAASKAPAPRRSGLEWRAHGV
jgi:hypothetical protein